MSGGYAYRGGCLAAALELSTVADSSDEPRCDQGAYAAQLFFETTGNGMCIAELLDLNVEYLNSLV